MPARLSQEKSNPGASVPASGSAPADPVVSEGNGDLGSLLEQAAQSEHIGLTFQGIVIAKATVRSGTSAANKPYAISSQKLLAGENTYVHMVIRKTESELPVPPKVGSMIKIEVESADKRSRDSDIELVGEIVPLAS